MIPRKWAPGQACDIRYCAPGAAEPLPLAAAHWQVELQQGVRDTAELWRLLELPEALRPATYESPAFPLKVPRGFVARMRKGDPADPLLRQVLPLHAETQAMPGFIADPVGDGDAVAVPGTLHKYHGRALIITTGACAIHCRYCFRREFPYADHHALGAAWPQTLAYLAAHDDIHEVILSGGDPLLQSDARLAAMFASLAAIPHLRTLRVHTRLPIVLPSRVTRELLSVFTQQRLTPVVVVHANHPQELDATTADALRSMANAGIRLFNQAVLLRGVNDDADCLARLCTRIFELGVTPYYLHLLDRVQGAAHFEVAEAEALALHSTLEARLPGYLVPRLVREVPGAPAKTRLR